MYVSGRKYFIAAAHSYQYDRLPEPVRIGAPAGRGRSGVPGDLYQHPGRSGGVPRDVPEKAIYINKKGWLEIENAIWRHVGVKISHKKQIYPL